MQAVPTNYPQSNIRIKKRPVPRPLKRFCYRLHLIIISFPGMWPRQRLYVIAVTPLCRILCFLSPIRLLHCESHGLGLAHVFLVEFRMVGGKCPCIKLIADNSLESNHPVTHLCFLLSPGLQLLLDVLLQEFHLLFNGFLLGLQDLKVIDLLK